jgi:hypothetical protein
MIIGIAYGMNSSSAMRICVSADGIGEAVTHVGKFLDGIGDRTLQSCTPLRPETDLYSPRHTLLKSLLLNFFEPVITS